jgi:hypothetical protein
VIEVLLPFNFAPMRKSMISAPAFRAFRKVMPPMSRTEKEGNRMIASGSSSQIFHRPAAPSAAVQASKITLLSSIVATVVLLGALFYHRVSLLLSSVILLAWTAALGADIPQTGRAERCGPGEQDHAAEQQADPVIEERTEYQYITSGQTSYKHREHFSMMILSIVATVVLLGALLIEERTE